MPVGSTKVNPLLAAAPATASDLDAIARLGQARQKLKEEIAKVIVGQEHIVDDLLTAVFARGHCLMIGVPGLAKTLMVRTIRVFASPGTPIIRQWPRANRAVSRSSTTCS